MDLIDSYCISGSDSDSDDCNQKVFEVPSAEEEEDLSAPPMTGEQYLQRVRKESKCLKKVVIADSKGLKPQIRCQVPKFPETKECKKELKLDQNEQLACIDDFTVLRGEIEAKRQQMAETKPFIEIQNSKQLQTQKDWLEFCTESNPDNTGPKNLSTLMCIAISQPQIWSLLKYFGEWLDKKRLPIKEGCRWLYCLLACLETPVDSDVHSDLRAIARVLINHRAQMETPDLDLLPHLNLVICIIGRYFNQTDLADSF